MKRKHKTCTCDQCRYFWYKPPCRACGHHDSFWATVIESKEWKAWKKHQDKIGWQWDFSEVEETGQISPQHFKEFINYLSTYKDVDKLN
jgi:hypothetical protein